MVLSDTREVLGLCEKCPAADYKTLQTRSRGPSRVHTSSKDPRSNNPFDLINLDLLDLDLYQTVHTHRYQPCMLVFVSSTKSMHTSLRSYRFLDLSLHLHPHNHGNTVLSRLRLILHSSFMEICHGRFCVIDGQTKRTAGANRKLLSPRSMWSNQRTDANKWWLRETM